MGSRGRGSAWSRAIATGTLVLVARLGSGERPAYSRFSGRSMMSRMASLGDLP